jgi:hypothetical protein
MDQMPREDDAVEVAVDRSVAGGLDRRGTPHGPFRRFLRGFIHFFSYLCVPKIRFCNNGGEGRRGQAVM